MPSYNLNPEHIMRDVYSYPFPEVREHIRSLNLDPDFMLNTIPCTKAAELLEPYNFQPSLELPGRSDGSLDLDELHIPVIERIRGQVEQSLNGLGTFEYAYPNHGSSQAMFTLMAEWKAKGKLGSIAVLDGEYEGYSAYAESLGIPMQKYEHLEDASFTPDQVWFLSNPSALDGNWIGEDTWKNFVEAGHEIVADAAYVGLTQKRELDVTPTNIRAVLTSPSKIFGVFRYRNTGITYTREPVDAMYGTKWFKDVPALLDTLSLYEKFSGNVLPQKYRAAQAFLCRKLTEVVNAEVVPSDVLLLANSKGPVTDQYQPFRRAKAYRFGLTKLFEDLEQNQDAD